MPALGVRNTLLILRDTAPGFYLHGGDLGEILLPGRYIPKGAVPGHTIDVFLYRDSEDRIVATTETPHLMVGEYGLLKVLSANRRMGAFLDWGLSKDLLLPLREQAKPVAAGDWVVAGVFLDPQSGRIVATTRLNDHVRNEAPAYSPGAPVRFLIAERTSLGYKAIVENSHWGLLYHAELSAPLEIGQVHDGFIRAVREDGKIDLRLDASGYERVAPLADRILAALDAQDGKLEYDDQSPPEEIRLAFNTSKKAFKQAIGALYRDRRIRFTKPGIERVDESS